MEKRLKVLHVITGLHVGGAEMMLFKLASALRGGEFENRLLVLMPPSHFTPRFREMGVDVVHLDIGRGLRALPALVRAFRSLRRFGPDVIQGWMYHGNLAATLLGLMFPRTPVLWNVRATFRTFAHEKRATVLLVKASARLSGLPRAIVYNSGLGARSHESLGYRPEKSVVIPNGFDMPGAVPPRAEMRSARESLGLRPQSLVIALVGRFHPMKDHRTFFRAAGLLLKRGIDAEFVLAGRDVTPGNAEIAGWVEENGLRGRAHLLGERSDIPRLMPAFDISTLCSTDGESFPNVVGEAMAWSIPCVVTACGDAAAIVADTGLVVPFRDPENLAEAWAKLSGLGPEGRAELGARARARVENLFSLPSVTQKYRKLYLEAVARRPPRISRAALEQTPA